MDSSYQIISQEALNYSLRHHKALQYDTKINKMCKILAFFFLLKQFNQI